MSEADNQLLYRALLFALDVHDVQVDKNGELFVLHPIRVGLKLQAAGHRAAVVAAGFSHDEVEDTAQNLEPITLDDVEDELGIEVREIVDSMTRRGHLEGEKWVWDETYKEYIRRCCQNSDARAVKKCDVEDNFDPRRRCPEVPIGRYYWTLEYIEKLEREEAGQ